MLKMAPILFIGTFLAGCATAPTAPPLMTGATALPPQQVPVLIPCVTREEMPTPPPTYMRREHSGDKTEIAAAADLAEATAYMVKADSLLRGCVKTFEAEKPK